MSGGSVVRRIRDTGGLTQQQEKFAVHVAAHGDLRAAYEHAYGKKPTWKPSSVNRQARRLMAQPQVRARVEALRAEIAAIAKERFKVDTAWMLKRLLDEVNADIADLFDEQQNLKPVREWPPIWRQGLVASLDIESRQDDDGRMVKVAKVRFSDRTKRLEMLGKHVDVKAFVERRALEVTQVNAVPLSETERFLERIAGAEASRPPNKPVPH